MSSDNTPISPSTPLRDHRTIQGYPVRSADYVPRRVLGIQHLARWKNDPDNSHPWLCRLIGTLFQSFVTSALPGQPAAEMLPFTAQLWVDVLIDMRLTEEQDRDRIEAAGRTLLRTLEEWPQVAALIAALPRRVAPAGDVTAHREPSEADRQAGREALAKLKEMF